MQILLIDMISVSVESILSWHSSESWDTKFACIYIHYCSRRRYGKLCLLTEICKTKVKGSPPFFEIGSGKRYTKS